MNSELQGKVALITGAGRGIGRAIALKFAQAGADVIVNYLEREDSASEVVEWIKGMGRKAVAIRADVSSELGVEMLFSQIPPEFNRLDILVNNAGPFMVRPVLETTTEDWDLMLRGNLLSAFWVTQHAVPRILVSENGGSIIFIGAPNAERVGSQNVSCAYSVAKTGVVILAQTLARDLGPKKIRVNVINPGFIENDTMTPRMKRWMPAEVPLGEIGQPGDIANAALYFASDNSAYASGSVLNVHGGLWI